MKTEKLILGNVEVLLMHDERPLVTMQIVEKNVEFLCNSGACRSVINGKTHILTPTRNTILVRATNGQGYP